MSGYKTFMSFANYVKTQLNGTGINVYIDKDVVLDPPYAHIQPGSQSFDLDSQVDSLCQIRLVVEKTENMDLPTAHGRITDKLLSKLLPDGYNPGIMPVYDFEANPAGREVGSFGYHIIGITPDVSQDPIRNEKVITFQLYSGSYY